MNEYQLHDYYNEPINRHDLIDFLTDNLKIEIKSDNIDNNIEVKLLLRGEEISKDSINIPYQFR